MWSKDWIGMKFTLQQHTVSAKHVGALQRNETQDLAITQISPTQKKIKVQRRPFTGIFIIKNTIEQMK